MDILEQLNQIALERDLPLADLQHELEEALGAAYQRHVGTRQFGLEGAARVCHDPRQIAWTGAHAEAVRRDQGCLSDGIGRHSRFRGLRRSAIGCRETSPGRLSGA